MKIYFNTLKWKKSNGKPVWWPTSLSFEKFEHYSYATMRQNKLILKSILEHFDLDPTVHCKNPEMPVVKKKGKTAKKKDTINEDSGEKRKNAEQEGYEESDEEDGNDVLENLKNKGILRMGRKRARNSSPSSSKSTSCSPSTRNNSPTPPPLVTATQPISHSPDRSIKLLSG